MNFEIMTTSAIVHLAKSVDHIEPLTGSNFPLWRDQIMCILGLNKLDLALREVKPVAPTVSAAGYEELKRAYDAKVEKLEDSNRMSLLIIKMVISEGIKGAIPDSPNVSDYLKSI